VVQRHPAGSVRLVGPFGVYRWDGLDWHHEPLVASWIDAVSACGEHGDREVLQTMLEFAVHDLGARGIGATLVYRPDDSLRGRHDDRLPTPPLLHITRPFDLAPLRHALAQIDGATLFDEEGVLRRIGVRLVPSAAAEATITAIGGTRHTSGRRYSFDDPDATVIVVSEDGPVTVLRAGEVLGASRTEVVGDG
jgi:DNA integrity scanning protein DisA with diadenylate cyclase activity